MATWKLLLLVGALCTLGERLDVERHGAVHLVHAWRNELVDVVGPWVQGSTL